MRYTTGENMRCLFSWVVVLALHVSGNEARADTIAQSSVRTELPKARPDIIEDKFALLALSCIHRPYPNKISHVLQSDSDAKPPSELTPAFYGCYDWHSSVHGHWLLARILNIEPGSPMRPAIESALARSLTSRNIAREVAYFAAKGRKSFERPYGLVWLMQLVAELQESDNAQLASLRENLRPLEEVVLAQIKAWLPDLHYPIRTGTHNQTAFAFGLMLDYSHVTGEAELASLIAGKAIDFYGSDTDCPLSYEPSGEDFLSPCLMEADLMRRLLSQEDFAVWLTAFLPDVPVAGGGGWLTPGVVSDPTDGKLAHLYGLNLSRAWALEGIADALPLDDPRRASLRASAALHRKMGIAAVSDEHYEGSHWLGSFAVYLTTKSGIIVRDQ